jgi:hypothetical protein
MIVWLMYDVHMYSMMYIPRSSPVEEQMSCVAVRVWRGCLLVRPASVVQVILAPRFFLSCLLC